MRVYFSIASQSFINTWSAKRWWCWQYYCIKTSVVDPPKGHYRIRQSKKTDIKTCNFSCIWKTQYEEGGWFRGFISVVDLLFGQIHIQGSVPRTRDGIWNSIAWICWMKAFFLLPYFLCQTPSVSRRALFLWIGIFLNPKILFNSILNVIPRSRYRALNLNLATKLIKPT